ncbi:MULTISPECIES: hypothetical protein [Henriciella]|jgi:hypothetical protein|uniref:Uncharacterized protein n=1 Tax=Henriciella pelagia TaxID=1977912 RepID=A0ABQ1J546_9PROT|nr:hypothetical protein [Henriciella pelagia]GGB58900.1 hypothetical protein GCM10011503_04130 [Henriciella pelagia]
MSIHHLVVSNSSRPYCYVSPVEMIRDMGQFGLRPCAGSDIREALRIGEQLLGGKLARKEVITTLDAITQMTMWIIGDPIDGLYITVPLTEEGRVAVENGEFNPADPALRHVAPRNTPIFGLYVGVYAAASKQARRNIMAASASVRVSLFAPVPCYARGATEDGQRSMLRLGFRRLSGGLPDLFVFDPIE